MLVPTWWRPLQPTGLSMWKRKGASSTGRRNGPVTMTGQRHGRSSCHSEENRAVGTPAAQPGIPCPVRGSSNGTAAGGVAGSRPMPGEDIGSDPLDPPGKVPGGGGLCGTPCGAVAEGRPASRGPAEQRSAAFGDYWTLPIARCVVDPRAFQSSALAYHACGTV